jgi:hypothetical protein
MNRLCPTCSRPMYRHVGMLDSIHCVDCGAICGGRSADYRGTEERTKRRHFAECRGGPADGKMFSFEGPPPEIHYVAREPNAFGGLLPPPGGGLSLIENPLYTSEPVAGEPWSYRPARTAVGYARNAEWRFIYEFCG